MRYLRCTQHPAPSTQHSFHPLLVPMSSCAQLRSHLYVALDAGYLPQSESDHIEQQALTVARTIGALRASLGKP